MKQKRLSQEEVEKIQELKEQGKTQREIASEIGISEAAISKNLTSDKCQKLNLDPAPDFSSSESSNVIKAPVQFQKQEPIDDYPMLGFDRFLRGSSPHLSNLDR